MKKLALYLTAALVAMSVIFVACKDPKVSGVSLDRANASMVVGETLQLAVSVQPGDAGIKTVGWRSSNSSVAEVSNGKVAARSAGEAIITVFALDQKDKEATCRVVVSAIGIASVELPATAQVWIDADSVTLEATVLPAEASYKELRWTSSDTSKLRVDVRTGRLTILDTGVAKITATSTFDATKSATCTVTVPYIAVTGITLNVTDTTLSSSPVRQEFDLKAILTPAHAYNKVTWVSSNNDIVRCNSTTGRIIAMKEGVETITATTKSGNKTATCTVTVDNDARKSRGK